MPPQKSEPYINKPAAAFLPVMVAVFTVFILIFPREMTDAAKTGVNLWFFNVLPSLAPFIIGANLLMALGAVHFIGVLLTPVMKPLFGVPGSGGFAFAVGLMSGNPVGAKIVCELREQNALTKTEGQRLLAFACNCGPLFILGTVAAVMLGNAAAGYYIITAHIAGAVILGLLFKNYKPRENEPYAGFGAMGRARSPLRAAFYAMLNHRKQSNKPIGQSLAESVAKTMETLLLIGGFIIVFTVLGAALEIMGVFAALSNAVSPIFGVDGGIVEGIAKSVLEMTNGANALTAGGGGRTELLALIGAVSWGGLSVHAQAAGYISKTDLSVAVYLLSKLLHAAVSVVIGIILYPVFRPSVERAVPAGSFNGGMTDRFIQSSVFFGYFVVFILVIVTFTAVFNVLRRKRRY
jgi:sporulation integral membrane protein YlbJ